MIYRLLGDKSPFTQQNLQGDGMDRDEETARIQCNIFPFIIASVLNFFLGVQHNETNHAK